MKELTHRQKELLSFIQEHVQLYGFPPSIREMADHMGIRSTNGVNDHLKALERKGYISRQKELKSRAISLTGPSTEVGHHPQSSSASQLIAVPILGRVAAGTPVLSEENMEGTIYLGNSLVPSGKNIFALRVNGDSMIEKGIFDGDLVIVRSQQKACSGEIVVALVDGEATVKTFRIKKDTIHLEPANPNMKSIVIHRNKMKPTNIIGVVTGVYRQIQQT